MLNKPKMTDGFIQEDLYEALHETVWKKIQEVLLYWHAKFSRHRSVIYKVEVKTHKTSRIPKQNYYIYEAYLKGLIIN